MSNLKLKLLTLILFVVFASNANAINIVNLENDESVRSNEGTLVIEVEADEPFALLIDRNVVITMNPTVLVTKFTLYNIDRGTHFIQAVETTGERKKIDQIFVHMLRTHK